MFIKGRKRKLLQKVIGTQKKSHTEKFLNKMFNKNKDGLPTRAQTCIRKSWLCSEPCQ